MASQSRKLISPSGTVYVTTGEDYWPEYSSGDIALLTGHHTVEVLHRVEGNAWVLEKMEVMEGEIVSKECERATDEEAKQILISMNEADVLLKYKLGKLYGADAETKEEIYENEEITNSKTPRQIPFAWLTKLNQVRDELKKLAERKGNDPEQQSALKDCIKQINAIEQLAECETMDSWWRSFIKQALQRILRVAEKAGDELVLAGIRELVNQLTNQ